MRSRFSLTLLLGAVAACDAGDRPPEPSFDLLFPALSNELMTMSSPNLTDLNGDGAGDIVFGTGKDRLRPEGDRYVFTNEPAVPGYVIAVSGATNEVLWKAPHTGEAFTTPRFADVNRDGTPDVIMGGREAALGAYSGRDGALLWRADRNTVANTPVPYNFFTPAFIRDADNDGMDDLLVVYGGDDTQLPGAPRSTGYVALISTATGRVIVARPTPDGRESYSSIVVYDRADGAQWFVFGTGGETQPGTSYRAPVAALIDGTFAQRATPLIAAGTKGVIAPATLLELTGDNERDIVISTFDGRVIAVNGATAETIWEQRADGEEAYHQPAVVRIDDNGALGFFVSRGIGVFPQYTGSTHRLYEAETGRVLFQHRSQLQPAGAPLAVDLTGDGIDEPFFFAMRYPVGQGGIIHVLHMPSNTVITQNVPANPASTPFIGDPRNTGKLELIGLSWSIMSGDGTPDWQDLQSQMFRADLSADVPAVRSWAAYMGTSLDGSYKKPAAR
jgi:outer membrane protein assembly factor BamB